MGKIDVNSLIESVKKGGSVRRILEDENGNGTGLIDPDKAKEVMEMLQDAQTIMGSAYEKLMSAMEPVAMEDETVKQTMENLGKMTEDLDGVKDGIASMAGIEEPATEEFEDDDKDGDMDEEDEVDPTALDTPSVHQFTVKGANDDQGLMNDIADVCQKYGAVMTANEEDTILSPETEPRVGDGEDDKEVAKDIKAHMDLEGKYRKFRVTEGISTLIKARTIKPRNQRRKFESKKKKTNRKFGK